MQVNEENHMAAPIGNELAPAGAQYPVPDTAGPEGIISDHGESAPELQPAAAQPNLAGKTYPHWLMPALAGTAALATAAAVALSVPSVRTQVQSFFNPNYGAATGEQEVNRARLVGLQLDLDGVSPENVAAIMDGEDPIVAALHSQLTDIYGDNAAFDFYCYNYSRPTEDGEEFVPFDPNYTWGDDDDSRPKDTITIPLCGITGDITPENRDQVIAGLLGQITPQLEQWGYTPEETTIRFDETTGEYVITVSATEGASEDTTEQPPATSGGKPPTHSSVPGTQPPIPPTQKPTVPSQPSTSTTKAPTTTKKPESLTPPKTLTLGKDLSMSNAANLSSSVVDTDLTFAENPKWAPYENAEGKWAILRAKCTPDNYKNGAVFYIYLDREKDGTYNYIDTVRNSKLGEGNLESIATHLVLSSGDLNITAPRGYAIIDQDIDFYVRSSNSSSTPAVDITRGGNASAEVIGFNGELYKFNGVSFDRISVSNLY